MQSLLCWEVGSTDPREVYPHIYHIGDFWVDPGGFPDTEGGLGGGLGTFLEDGGRGMDSGLHIQPHSQRGRGLSPAGRAGAHLISLLMASSCS